MNSLETKLERIEALKAEKEVFKDILDFFEKIFIKKEEIRQKVEEFKDYPDKDGILLRLKDGFPLADSKSFKPDIILFEEYFFALLDILADKNADAVQYLKDTLKDADGGFGSFFEKISEADAEAYIGSFEKGRDILVFVINEAVKPFFEKYCEGIKDEIKEEDWTDGSCPVCGGFPSLSELRGEEGKRYLVCPDCSMEWAFDRIRCPFCSTREQKDMEYFTPEKESRYRVMLCKSCHHYLKVLDFREMEKPPVFEIEHLATLHLDVLAKEEGYETEDALVNLIL